ncbi:MAG: orotate phosphoribosyltransferase [Candidatus Peribacteria bacterium]|nr:orotate phosphoribosyltransferase [Candidatus Peribacteria bacterium]
MPHGQRIAEFLLSIGAVRLQPNDPFIWASGIKSPVYCDNRMIYSHPEARNFVVDALASRVRSLHIEADVIAGTATAAIGWAALVADRLHLPFIYVRSKPKEHGAKKRIEGDLQPGRHVVVIEDLISTAGSSISTVEALRDEGQASVSDIVSIFSYGFDAAHEAAVCSNIHLHPLTSLATLLTVAVEQARINPEDVDMIRSFAEEPQEWARKMGL